MTKEINYQEEIKNCKSVEDLVGKNGLMKKLFKDVMQQLLDAEMEEHLGRVKYERGQDEEDKNYRNGSSNKIVRSSYGDVELDIPNAIKDRKLQFKETKTKKLQNRPISNGIYMLIMEYVYENNLGKDDPIFQFTKRYVSKYLKIVAEHLGLSNIGTHSFRKFYATNIYYKSGKDIGVVRDLLNHSSTVITENYININKEKIDEVSASMELIVIG